MGVAKGGGGRLSPPPPRADLEEDFGGGEDFLNILDK